MHSQQNRESVRKEILRRVLVAIFAVKALSITYSECVFVTLVIQHTMRMRRITLSSVACLALPHF